MLSIHGEHNFPPPGEYQDPPPHGIYPRYRCLYYSLNERHIHLQIKWSQFQNPSNPVEDLPDLQKGRIVDGFPSHHFPKARSIVQLYHWLVNFVSDWVIHWVLQAMQESPSPGEVKANSFHWNPEGSSCGSSVQPSQLRPVHRPIESFRSLPGPD